jgi:hypothetical protein
MWQWFHQVNAMQIDYSCCNFYNSSNRTYFSYQSCWKNLHSSGKNFKSSMTVVLTSFKCPSNIYENQLIDQLNDVLIHEELVLVSKYGLQVYCCFKVYLIFFVHRRYGTQPWAFFQWGFLFKSTFRVLVCFHTMVQCKIKSTIEHIMIIAYLANNIPLILVLSFLLHLQLGHGFQLETFLELSIWLFLIPNVSSNKMF